MWDCADCAACLAVCPNIQEADMAQGPSNVDWQTNLTQIHQRASHVLKTGQWSDCTFIVGNETNQKTFHGHRLILAMSSPVFEAMFYGGMAEKEDKAVEILDVQPDAFKALLQYIYSDEINLQSFDQVCEICYAAKKYMIPALVEQCTKFIWSDLHPGNVCRAYEFARLFEEPSLIDKCLQILHSKTEQVLKHMSFVDIEVSTLRIVLQQENLSASEAMLWEGCLRWAKQECRRQSLDPNQPANQRQVLGESLGLIRFLTFTANEFAKGPAVCGILSQDESYTLLMNISSPGVMPVPAPFSQNLKRRQKEPSPPPPTPPDPRNVTVRDEVQLRCTCTGDMMNDILINDQLVDCSLSFSVDGNVRIYGVEMRTQMVPQALEQQPNGQAVPQSYPELIYAFLQDSDGCRLTYTHYTASVSWNSTMEVMFNRPICIMPNKTYKIGVVLNRVGRYPLYVTAQYVTVEYLTFTFGQDRSRDTLIKALIFGCTPPRVPTSPSPFWPY